MAKRITSANDDANRAISGTKPARTAGAATAEATPPRDVALLAGPTADGKGARVLRVKDGHVSAGEVRPAREGQPLGDGELVRLKPVHPELPLCEVETLYAPPAPDGPDGPGKRSHAHDGQRLAPHEPTRAGVGPARVSNDTYRKNWNAIFGSKPKKQRGRRSRDWSIN